MSFQLPLFLPLFHQPSPGHPRPQSPLPVIHGHLLPASDFPSSSSVHQWPPLSQPHSLNCMPTSPRDRVTGIWSPVRDRPASRSPPIPLLLCRGPRALLPPHALQAPAPKTLSRPSRHPSFRSSPPPPLQLQASRCSTHADRTLPGPAWRGSPLSPQTLRRNPLKVRGRWGPTQVLVARWPLRAWMGSGGIG